MMQITVDVRGIDEVLRKLDGLAESMRGRAVAAALNKTAAKGRTEIDRAIRAEYAISAARVRNSLMLRRASAKAGGQLEAVISIFGSASRRGRSLNVIHFVERKVTLAELRRRRKAGDRQLRFRFKRAGPLKIITGAFIGNRGRTVFIREGRGRLPIKPVQVIDIPQMFTSRKISERVLERIRSELPVEVDRAIRMVMSR